MERLRTNLRNVERYLQPAFQRALADKYGGFVRRASVEDALSVAQRLRDDDRREVLATVGLPAELVIPQAVQLGHRIYVSGLLEDGVPEIIHGIDPIYGDPGAAVVWMVSTDRIYEHPQLFAPASRDLYEAVHEEFEFLTNFIDARNTRHIRWLRWLGFRFIRRVESFGAQSLPFLEFVSFRPPCV